MSDQPTLYELRCDNTCRNFEDHLMHFVPVEPCEHGYTDPHVIEIDRGELYEVVECPGAGIGDNDESA